jgi:SAM-dependent methyltransferase
MLDATGERLVPDRQRGELVHAEHLARYLYAASLAAGRATLDAACGEGYGSAILAAAGARSVVGVDIDAPTLEHARERHGIDARRADVRELPFPDGAFDLVVSFETIEHVEEPERAVAEMRRVLADDGTLVISTPNPDQYLVSTEFHVREFTPAEFEALLRSHFDSVDFAYQRNWLASAVLGRGEAETADESTPLDVAVHKTVASAPGDQLYTIAICGGADVADLRPVATLGRIDESHRLSKLLDEWTARATEAERLVEEWHGRANQAEALVERWRERAEEAERQFQEQSAVVAELQGSLSWRMTAPLRAVKRMRAGGR